MSNTISDVVAVGTTSAMPLLSSIGLTGLTMAAVITSQGTERPGAGLVFVTVLLFAVGTVLIGRYFPRRASLVPPSLVHMVTGDGLATPSRAAERRHASVSPGPGSLAG